VSVSVAAVFDDELQIIIPFRDSKLTKVALKHAVRFVDGTDSRVLLVDVQIVPYGVPLDHPPCDLQPVERRLKHLAKDCALPVSVEVVYARDWERGFRCVLAPGAIVLLPIYMSWWTTREKRLAARLRKLGHPVVWVRCD